MLTKLASLVAEVLSIVVFFGLVFVLVALVAQ